MSTRHWRPCKALNVINMYGIFLLCTILILRVLVVFTNFRDGIGICDLFLFGASFAEKKRKILIFWLDNEITIRSHFSFLSSNWFPNLNNTIWFIVECGQSREDWAVEDKWGEKIWSDFSPCWQLRLICRLWFCGSVNFGYSTDNLYNTGIEKNVQNFQPGQTEICWEEQDQRRCLYLSLLTR